MELLYKNNLHKKLTIANFFLIYLFSITLIPVVNSITRNHKKNYIYVNNIVITKFNTSTYSKKINNITYINNGHILDRQIDNNNLQSYINDAKGSVLKLNDLNDAVNDQIYSYDAYGNVITSPSQSQSKNSMYSNIVSSIPNSFQYNGERSDNNSKLQYLRARFYNSTTKRFINQDTYDLLNKFGYVDANSVMNIDSNGHDSSSFIIEDVLKIVGSVVASALGAVASLYAGYKYFLYRGKKEAMTKKIYAAFGCSDEEKFLPQLKKYIRSRSCNTALINLNISAAERLSSYVRQEDLTEIPPLMPKNNLCISGESGFARCEYPQSWFRKLLRLKEKKWSIFLPSSKDIVVNFERANNKEMPTAIKDMMNEYEIFFRKRMFGDAKNRDIDFWNRNNFSQQRKFYPIEGDVGDEILMASRFCEFVVDNNCRVERNCKETKITYNDINKISLYDIKIMYEAARLFNSAIIMQR